MSKGEEVRITSPTGGMKGSKPSQLGWVDPAALKVLGEVAGKGAEKYGDGHNFLKGYDWQLSYDAMMRHMMAFWSGEDADPETGLPHTAHAAWHALALTSFQLHGLGADGRWSTKRRAEAERVSEITKSLFRIPGGAA